MDTIYELWQTGGNGGYKLLVGTYDTWDDAFEVAKQRNEKCNDEGNFWAEMYYEMDCFIIVEEGLTPHKLKRALKYAGNIDFKKMKWLGKENYGENYGKNDATTGLGVCTRPANSTSDRIGLLRLHSFSTCRERE